MTARRRPRIRSGEARAARGAVLRDDHLGIARLHTLLAGILILGAVVVPLVVSRYGFDPYRLPKRILFEAEATLCVIAIIIGVGLFGSRFFDPLRRFRIELSLIGAVLVWTAVTTVTSTNRALSLESLVWVAACATVAVSVLLVSRGRWKALLAAALLPVVINAVITIGQWSGTFNPLRFAEGVSGRSLVVGLIGNPNTLATYLAFGAIAAFPLIFAASRHLRAAGITVVGLSAIAIVASQTLSAIGAFAAAAMIAASLKFRRPVVAVSLGLLTLLVTFYVHPGLRQRGLTIATAVRDGRYNEALSARVPAFHIGLALFRDHRIVGAGPGTYSWWYLPYKLELNRADPLSSTVRDHFSESHNDHLQTLAVAGIPGYLLLLCAGGIVALGSRGANGRDAGVTTDAGEWSRLVSLPLTVGFLVVALTQFPLEHAGISSLLFNLIPLAAGASRK